MQRGKGKCKQTALWRLTEYATFRSVKYWKLSTNLSVLARVYALGGGFVRRSVDVRCAELWERDLAKTLKTFHGPMTRLVLFLWTSLLGKEK